MAKSKIPGRLYDWTPNMRWRHLQVENPPPSAYGIHRVFNADGSPQDVLCQLLRSGLLQGQALEDAKGLCKVEPVAQKPAEPVKDDW